MSLQISEQKSASATQWGEIVGLIRSFAVFLGIAFMLRASVVEAFKIPSTSMVPTLQVHDHILVNKLSYGMRAPLLAKTVFNFREPKRGDVVVFTLPDNPATPEDESDTNIIKRVIGLPGETLEVRGTKVFIDGTEYDHDREYAVWVNGGRKNFGPVTIPPGKVILLGDNRDQSKDSRYWPEPFLDVSRIKGRAFIIYWNSGLLLKRMFSIIH